MSEQRSANRPGMRPGGGRHMGPPMGRPVEKAKNFKVSLKRLIGYLKPHRINLIIVLIFAIASTVFTVYSPNITRKAMNKLQDGYMANMMLKEMAKGQEEAVDQINKQMFTAQINMIDQTEAKMGDGQKAAVYQIEKQMAEVQKNVFQQISQQMQQLKAPQIQAGTASQMNNANVPQMDPEALKAIQEFMELPMLDTITDPQQKADTVIKMIDLLEKMPAVPNSQRGSQQIDPAAMGSIKELLKLPTLDAINDPEQKVEVTLQLIDIFKNMPDISQQGSQQIDPAVMDSIKELLALPLLDTVQDRQKKTDITMQMLDIFSQMPALPQGSAAQSDAKEMTPETIGTIKELLGLPMLNSVEDAGQKADIVQKFIDLGKKLPEDQQSVDKNMKFTQEQIDGAIKAIRETNGKIDITYIGWIALVLIGLYIMSSSFSLIMGLVMAGVSQKTVRDLRREVDNKLARLPLKYFDMHPHGDILSRVTNDIDTIATTLQQSLTQIITSVVTIIGYIIMMLTISPILTLIVLGTMPLYVVTTTLIAKKSQKYFASQQKELGELSGHVEEMYTGHKIVRAFGRERDSIKKFGEVNDRLYDAGWRAQFVSGIMFPLMNFISNVGYVMICIVGGIWITKNRLKIGDITAFIQYSRSFTMPIVQTANIANIIQSTVACAERVFEVLDEQEEVPDSTDAKLINSPKGEVSFEHVAFRYKEEVPLIDDMNLHVKQGDTIAIVGPTGAGKTTLINLLMRFYEINAGSITVDGMDIRDIKRSDLRKMFGMVLQDTWLFNGTIKDNIAYGREDATMEEIVDAAKAAYADHFIRTLPDGYDTILNEEATNISQGQKQLLTIARAILADPAILILDEATSSVDTRTEVLIQQAMANLMKGRTSFVIAHRLSTIRDAKMILVMNHGSIIEQGNHMQLLDKNGFYADLYNSQFSDTDTEAEAI